jgi:hypothetical protein
VLVGTMITISVVRANGTPTGVEVPQFRVAAALLLPSD